jgi:ligand-binding sensor domain-containing protein/AraC-like DNA-binding protein
LPGGFIAASRKLKKSPNSIEIQRHLFYYSISKRNKIHMEGQKRPIVCTAWQIKAAAVMIILFWSQLPGLNPDKPVDQYLVDQWGLADGIPADEVRSIAQTPDGYLWIATSRGLVRFDGMKFTIIRFIEEEGIESLENTIPDTLFVNREGTLFIGSVEGLTSHRRQTGGFKTYTAAHGMTRDRIRRIAEDINGNLWISFFSNYLDRFSNGEFTAFNASHGLEGNKINAIVERQNGNLLFGTRENGVFIHKDGKFLKYPIAGLETILINIMHEDQTGDLWVGTNKGLFRVIDRGTLKYSTRDGLSNDHITYITEDSDRNLWIGTAKGLNRLKKKQDGTIDAASLLKQVTIFCIYEDKEKSLWIGTYSSGIMRLKDSKFISYVPLRAHQEEIFFSLWENQQGDTWIGTFKGKLYRCRGSRLIESIEPPELSDTGITAIAGDTGGNLWLGTNGKGVFQKKNKSFLQFTTREGLADNLVTSICKDSRGNLWFGTFDGVSVIRGNSMVMESFKSRHGLSAKRVHNVYEDKRKNILIATDKGVTVLKEGKTSTKNIKHYLKDYCVTCIYEDPDVTDDENSVYWLATHGGGLKRLKDGAITSYTTAQGMTTNFLYQFFEDQRDNFWLMSDSGILRVNKKELNAFPNSGDQINCTSFGISAGMKSLEFNNKFSRHSALKTRIGEFWFITKKGITIMNPGKIRINKFPPPVVMEAAFFNQQSIPLHHDKEMNSFKGITDFRFHFTAPTFLSPGKIKFKYQLEGVDREWKSLPSGNERMASYKDLDPGTYTFKVTACNSDGVWNRTGDSFTFTIKSSFRETFLFKIILLIILIALAAAGIYIYKKFPFKKPSKIKTPILSPLFVEECIRKLRYLMEVEKVYCDPVISLRSLAKKLSIPRYQLSIILNKNLKQTFSKFINIYRVEEAKKILLDPKKTHLKITAVAYEVGFNTRVAFYKAFKKYTKMTPNQYKKKAGGKK